MDININKGRYIFVALIAFIMTAIISLDNIYTVGASGGSDGGTGSPIHNGQAGTWFHSGDPYYNGVGESNAWKSFEREALKKRSASHLKSTINGLGRVGNFDGTLYDACRQSKFIWWYGSQFDTWIGDNVHPSPANMPYSDGAAEISFLKFMNLPNNGWYQSGGTVLVCSWAFDKEDPVPLTFRADSGTFRYDGSLKTVDGYKLIKGELIEPYHQHRATARRSERDVGTYNVTFTSPAKILDGSTDVTHLYDITHIRGQLDIWDRRSTEKCRTVATERVTEIVQSDVSIANGFAPEGSPGVAGAMKEHRNAAYPLLSSMPRVGDSRSVWNSWKSSFSQGGQDLSTKEFDLENHANAANILSKYGGVVNVTRTHHPYEVETVLCQPQKRDRLSRTDSEGNVTYYWGPWYDDTSKPVEVKSIKKTKKPVQNYSYQILGVNCNIDGFNRVKNDFNTVDWALGDGTASGLLQTVERSGLHFPLGRTSHYTGKEVFYKPDGVTWNNSCKDTYVGICTSDILTGSNIDNDADNNLQHNPLFTHKDEEEYSDNTPAGHSYPNEGNDELNFFRDNIDREVRAEVWYPADTGKVDLVNFPGEAAKRTTAKIFDNEFGIGYTPTPEIEVTTIAPWGTTDKFTSTGQEKEWNTHHNHFNMKSKWSSDNDKPYALGVDWAYRASAENVAPKRIDGYEIINQTGVKKYEFEAHCTFMNEKGNYDANITEFPFDPAGNSMKVNADWDESGKLKTLFTRSVSDRSDR